MEEEEEEKEDEEEEEGCYSREKPQGMIKVVNICRCRGQALVQN